MKILYITDPGIVGGATRALVEVVTAMKNRGVDVIVCTSEYNELNQELNDKDIKNFACYHRSVMDVRAGSWKYFVKQITKYYLSIKPAVKNIINNVDIRTIDIIHTNSARNDIGEVLAQKYHTKHIVHIREFGQEDFNCWVYRPFYISFFNKYTTRFLAISKAVYESWVLKGIDKEKIIIVYDGVDNKAIKAADISLFPSETHLKMVIVGGVCQTKGQYQIIEAMGRINKDIVNNLSLDIIGWSDEDYIHSLEERVLQLGLSKKIKFLGSRSDVYQLLCNYQIGLTCSKSEGFGRVTAEYMHAGLGVIASNAGANPELITDNVTGQLYELDNVDELAKCIEKYYLDRIFLCHCACNGQKYAKENFTKEINASKIHVIYQDLLNQ